MDNSTELLESTKVWWKSYISGDFSSVELLLSPDCTVQFSFHDSSGVSGVDDTMICLKETHSKLTQPSCRLDTSQLQHLRLMKNGRQTRFMLCGKIGQVSSNMGFALDWNCMLITRIVLVKNTPASNFFQDDTCGTVTNEVARDTAFVSSLLPASSSPSIPLEMTLKPPYFSPKPPPVPATVTVTVMECTNLKSRLVRFVGRPVSAYVVVEVSGCKRKTEVVKYDNYPCFDPTNSFIFQVSDEDRINGSIHFTVMDEHLINDDVLAETDIPLSSLKCHVDNTTPSEIKLPLILGETHFGLSFKSNNAVDDDPPMLRVRVSKVDVMQWWAEGEIRQRQNAETDRMKHLDELEKSSDLHGNKHSRRLSATAVSIADTSQSNATSTPSISVDEGEITPRTEWVDSKHVLICMECLATFSMTKRKHHCRACGEVFCNNCCGKKVRIGGKKQRVCNRCINSTFRNRSSIYDVSGENGYKAGSESDDEPEGESW